MTTELCIRPEAGRMTEDRFRETHPLGSVALDGYVQAKPNHDLGDGYLILDHHVGVERTATLSSGFQAFELVTGGLRSAVEADPRFPGLTVCADDPDEDVCTAWTILNNPELFERPNADTMLLLTLANQLDVTGGMFPFDPRDPLSESLAWIFEPYRTPRHNGELHTRDPQQYENIIRAVEQRILQRLHGGGDRLELDLHNEIIGGGPIGNIGEWHMVDEIGANARIGAFWETDVNAFATMSLRPDGTWRTIIGRRSALVPFDLPGLWDYLNVVEGCPENDKWGGSNTIGGSPKIGGSRLNQDELTYHINTYMRKWLIQRHS